MHLGISLLFYYHVYQQISLVQAFLQSLGLIHEPFWLTPGAKEYLVHLSTWSPQPPILYRRVENSFSTLFWVAMAVCCIVQHATLHSTAQHPCALQHNATQV